MIYAVELYLDKKTEKTVLDLTNRLPEPGEGNGSSKKQIRVTLGQFILNEEEKAADRLKKVLRQHKKGQAVFLSLGILPGGSLILCPSLTDFLYTLHVDVHEAFPEKDSQFFSPGNWLPHLVLAEYKGNKEALLEAVYRAAPDFNTISGDFERVALVRVEPDQKEICSFKLRE